MRHCRFLVSTLHSAPKPVCETHFHCRALCCSYWLQNRLSRESLDTVKLRMVNGSSSGDLNCKVRGDTSSFSSISPCEVRPKY
ncbi:hypothetical protein M404DRAFT_752237 [Pisolithus tinctorius Marx 270]|uniref:Uncharacterized protein n=1 Tax=Pisolithus tinctorius Marx 270 TaxID=870435 RepID=A0A0C3NZS0_PISTI|nr:hypothetical protein M404DRAFT_752237 [Pisolithus tinctorius Marx 270]